jgi:hypothetical protein
MEKSYGHLTLREIGKPADTGALSPTSQPTDVDCFHPLGPIYPAPFLVPASGSRAATLHRPKNGLPIWQPSGIPMAQMMKQDIDVQRLSASSPTEAGSVSRMLYRVPSIPPSASIVGRYRYLNSSCSGYDIAAWPVRSSLFKKGVLPTRRSSCSRRKSRFEVVEYDLSSLAVELGHVVFFDHRIERFVPLPAHHTLLRNDLEPVASGAGIKGLLAPGPLRIIPWNLFAGRESRGFILGDRHRFKSEQQRTSRAHQHQNDSSVQPAHILPVVSLQTRQQERRSGASDWHRSPGDSSCRRHAAASYHSNLSLGTRSRNSHQRVASRPPSSAASHKHSFEARSWPAASLHRNRSKYRPALRYGHQPMRRRASEPRVYSPQTLLHLEDW